MAHGPRLLRPVLAQRAGSEEPQTKQERECFMTKLASAFCLCSFHDRGARSPRERRRRFDFSQSNFVMRGSLRLPSDGLPPQLLVCVRTTVLARTTADRARPLPGGPFH